MKRMVSLSALLIVAAAAMAQPKSVLWDFWSPHDPGSSTSVDHAQWSAFLGVYLNVQPGGVNLLDYAGVSSADRAALNAYLDRLAAVEVRSLNRDEQMAFWINLYNALTVKVVLDHYPVDSIRDIKLSRGLFSSGPWQAKLLVVEGQELSLDDIEHRILRPIWNDSRIHYAVNCASIGCPNLQPVAFTADNLEELLERGAREYVNHPRGVSLDGNRLTLSSIYSWFSEDFGGEPGALEHVASYLDSGAEAVRAYRGRVRYDYDWSLNE